MEKLIHKIKENKISPEMNSANTVNEDFISVFQLLLTNEELVFQFMDMFPIPLEIFGPDGTVVFINKASLVMNNIPDPDLIVGKYNVVKDPVVNDQMGLRDGIRKVFRGESDILVAHDVAAPIEDLERRGVITEKPYEKSSMDWYLYSIKNKDKIAFVVFVCIVKKLYYGRPEVVKAKEYLDNHWQDEFNPKAIAKSANIGVTQLYKLFEQQTGMTPGDYHKKIVVEYLKEKLADKNLTIKQAFAACGVDSRGWFARVFKELTGMSPSAYRETLFGR